jgi:hypothetical protein
MVTGVSEFARELRVRAAERSLSGRPIVYLKVPVPAPPMGPKGRVIVSVDPDLIFTSRLPWAMGVSSPAWAKPWAVMVQITGTSSTVKVSWAVMDRVILSWPSARKVRSYRAKVMSGTRVRPSPGVRRI